MKPKRNSSSTHKCAVSPQSQIVVQGTNVVLCLVNSKSEPTRLNRSNIRTRHKTCTDNTTQRQEREQMVKRIFLSFEIGEIPFFSFSIVVFFGERNGRGPAFRGVNINLCITNTLFSRWSRVFSASMDTS